MYGLSDVKKGIKQPYLIAREINAFYSRDFRRLSYNHSGMNIFSQDWDNLIILDACRYDVFAQYADLPGKLEKRESRAAATPEFIEGNFMDKELHDTVYVTGNSWIFKKGADKNLYLVYDVVNPEDSKRSSKPTLITECAKEAAEKHPNKRLIVHYIRPHQPFIGPTADEIFAGRGSGQQPPDLYNKIQSGKVNISDELLKELYVENLEVVLPRVNELLEILGGKTVVSADHGELLGERTGPIPIKTYGHPRGMHVEELIMVPWSIHENGERKSITSEDPLPEPDKSYSMDERSVDQRLRDLGYKI